MEKESSSHMRLVSKRSQKEIELDDLGRKAQESAKNFIANALRVVAGAGKSERLVHDAAELVEAFTHYAEADPNHAYPAYDVGESLRAVLREDQRTPEAEAFTDLLSGSFRFVASKMMGQNTQLQAADKQIRKAISDLK